MYSINKDQTNPINVFAGDFPIVTEVGNVKSDANVRKLAPIIMGVDGITEATADKVADICGIAADEPTDGGVVFYMTGEFFADALTLPEGVTIEILKPAFRKLGIFLK